MATNFVFSMRRRYLIFFARWIRKIPGYRRCVSYQIPRGVNGADFQDGLLSDVKFRCEDPTRHEVSTAGARETFGKEAPEYAGTWLAPEYRQNQSRS